MISEALKNNSTLTLLDLSGDEWVNTETNNNEWMKEQDKQMKRKRYWIWRNKKDKWSIEK